VNNGFEKIHKQSNYQRKAYYCICVHKGKNWLIYNTILWFRVGAMIYFSGSNNSKNKKNNCSKKQTEKIKMATKHEFSIAT
jgi:hypothetical protein